MDYFCIHSGTNYIGNFWSLEELVVKMEYGIGNIVEMLEDGSRALVVGIVDQGAGVYKLREFGTDDIFDAFDSDFKLFRKSVRR